MATVEQTLKICCY